MKTYVAIAIFFGMVTSAQAQTVSEFLEDGYKIVTIAGPDPINHAYTIFFQKGTVFVSCLLDASDNTTKYCIKG